MENRALVILDQKLRDNGFTVATSQNPGTIFGFNVLQKKLPNGLVLQAFFHFGILHINLSPEEGYDNYDDGKIAEYRNLGEKLYLVEPIMSFVKSLEDNNQ